MIDWREFGLYLEVSGPGGEGRARHLDIDDQQRRTLLHALSGSIPPVGSSASLIVRLLGAPDEATSEALRYDLGIRKDYDFVFRLAQSGAICTSFGYERRTPRQLERMLSADDDAGVLRAKLVRLGATEREVSKLLGEPDDIRMVALRILELCEWGCPWSSVWASLRAERCPCPRCRRPPRPRRACHAHVRGWAVVRR